MHRPFNFFYKPLKLNYIKDPQDLNTGQSKYLTGTHNLNAQMVENTFVS